MHGHPVVVGDLRVDLAQRIPHIFMALEAVSNGIVGREFTKSVIPQS